jgi:hypothetical protein
MKAQILKIAGVKSEKEFYKKFPSEEAFMKKHGKEFKKAQTGAAINASQLHQPAFKPLSYQTQFDDVDKMMTGSTEAERQAALAKQQAAASQGGGGGGFDIAGLMKLAGGAMQGGEGMGDMGGAAAGASSVAAAARYGIDIRKAQNGTAAWYSQNPPGGATNYGQVQPANQLKSIGSTNPLATGGIGGFDVSKLGPQGVQEENTWSKVGGALGKYAGPVGDVISGIGELKKEKEARKAAEQARDVSKISLKAAESVDVDARRQQSENIAKQREAQMPVNTGEEFFPIYGVGTNVLARNGMMLQDGDNVKGDLPLNMALKNPQFAEQLRGQRNKITEEEEVVEPVMEVGPIFGPQNEEYDDLEQITDYSDPNEMTDAQSAAFMETYNRDQGKSTETFDSSSARDTWVHKTGLPWSEAKRLGYTGGSAKDNTKLLAELNDPRFRKENLRDSAPKQSTQTRTPIQHRETPTGKLTPIKKPIQSYAEAMKGKPKYGGAQGDIHVPDEGNMLTRIGERVANPMQTFGHYAQYGELPAEGFSKHSKNAFDQVLGLRNPAYWANAIGNASDYASEGEYKKAAWEALDAAPALGKIKYVKNIPFNKGLPPASVRRAGYLGEGAKRLGAAPARQLTGKAAKQIAPTNVPNFVMRKDGGPVGGNPGEIQNTFAPNDIYMDSGYEPLNDTNIKQYYQGGRLYQMQDGGAAAGGGTPWGAISQKATGIGQSLMGGQNAGGKIGSTVGSTLGMIGGPIGSAIGGFVGGIAGNALDTNAKRMKKAQDATQRNMQGMANANMAKGIQAQNQSYMEDGGWVSNDWTPQVIASFGGLNEQEVYDYAHEGMDTLRAGGHLRDYTPPSDRAMEIYEDGGKIQSYGLGGELQTHWGGGAETISRNPYLPGTGETVMFRGKSHEEYSPNGETGIGVTYGGNPVEVERGEPMVELEEGGTIDPETGEVQKSGVVFGNLQIPNQYIDMLGDKNAKGKKFKNYVADLSKIEEKQNSIIDKSSKQLNALDPINSFDKLTLTALQANIQGANMKLKEIADRKINAASLQNAINDTAEERGLVADDLARGKVKIDKEAQKQSAKFGGKFTQAQDGVYKIKGNLPGSIDYNPLGQTPREDLWKDESTYENVWKPKVYSAFSDPRRAEELVKNLESYKGQDFEDVQAAIKKGKTPEEKKAIAIKLATDKKVGPFHSIMDTVINQTLPDVTEAKTTPTVTTPAATKEEVAVEETPEKTNWWDTATTAFNAILPSIRPSDAEGLDTAQLYPEMFAMATNQVAPVQAQTFQPDLGIPYDISYQDQLNANQADYRAAQRMMGYNPAAQANLNAEKYQANQSVLANQFRANQEMKDKVYSENRNMLNQAKLTNLGIFDKQYERQTEALANTKATTQAALNSISDKYAKNKLENRELKTYENMYNYRFGPNFRAQNMNPLAQWDTDYKGASSEELEAMSAYKKAKEKREAAAAKKDAKETDKKRNGSIVKSYKNI